MSYRVVILISGQGSNCEAIASAIDKRSVDAIIVAVISNVADAPGLARARERGLETACLPHSDFSDRTAFDAALADLVDSYQPDILVTAGFMRILTATFVARFRGKVINIHPSLLPAYTGLRTHQRVLDDIASGAPPVHGCTIHFVTGDLDGGPCIAQATVPVLTRDTPEELAARVQIQEHQLFPQVLSWLANDRIKLVAGLDEAGEMVVLDDSILPPGGLRIDNLIVGDGYAPSSNAH